MSSVIRTTLFLAGGLCWFAAPLLLCVFTWSFLSNGAGSGIFWLSSLSGSVVLGLFHAIGFAAGACICFAIGIAFLAHGLVSPEREVRRATADHAD